METRRWTNPSQPQTLQIAVFLLYFRAVFGLLLGSAAFRFGLVVGLASVIGMAAGGFGIANEKKWGYQVAVAVALFDLLPFVLIVLNSGPGVLVSPAVMLSLLFPVALVALLLHPQSRDYQRLWFS
jgi:hypothetical protein